MSENGKSKNRRKRERWDKRNNGKGKEDISKNEKYSQKEEKKVKMTWEQKE